MGRIILLLILSLFAYQSLATNADFEVAIKLGRTEAQRKKSESYTRAKNFNPQIVFDNYTSNPDQSKYYDGVTQSNTQQMTNDTIQNKNQGSGSDISNSIDQHPRFVINKSDADMQHSQLLQSEADNIIHGVTSQYIDCQPKEICTNQYEQKQCIEAPQEIFQSCKKKLIIDVVPHETVTHYPLTAHLSVTDHNYAGISINAVNGRIDFKGPHDASFKLDGRLPANIDCSTLLGTITSRNGNAQLDSSSFPSCSNGLELVYHISGGHKLDLQIDMASKVVTHEIKDRWVDDCENVAHDSFCKLKSQQCDISTSTQVVQGIPVTRDCWQETYNYICRGGSGAGTCKTLRESSCEQVSSQCIAKSNDQCTQYSQTYRCPIKTCSKTTDIICGNGQDYCLDGDCTDHNYQQSKDFAKGVSALSAVADAAKQLDQSSMTIFSGHPTECSEKPIGYSNCCTETGWGQDIGLHNCPDAAKKLHVDRENKLAIKVGRYCSGPGPFPCIEHSQVFCVFSSKLAKIIQEQGRKKQLHIGFGSGKEPNCSGITPAQLQSLNLSKMNFQDFISDLKQNMKDPDLKQIQEKISEHVQNAQQTGKLND